MVFKTPDGYHLHSIDDVLKYYQKHKMLQQFSESIRKGFVAAQQEAKTVHSKHMQKIAKFLFPMPEIPAKFLDDAKDTDISREMRIQERTARLAEKVANSPKPVGVIPTATSAQSPVAVDNSSAATAATSMSATLEAAAVLDVAVERDGGQTTAAQTATAAPSTPAAAACTAETEDVSGAAASASDLCCSQHGSAPGSLTEGSFAGASDTDGAAPLPKTGAQSGAGAGAIPGDSGQVVVASGSSCLQGRSADCASDGDGDSAGKSQNAGEAGGEEVGRKRAREESSAEGLEKVVAHDVGSTCHESPSEERAE